MASRPGRCAGDDWVAVATDSETAAPALKADVAVSNGPDDPYASLIHTAVSWNAAPPLGFGASAPTSRLMPMPSS